MELMTVLAMMFGPVGVCALLGFGIQLVAGGLS